MGGVGAILVVAMHIGVLVLRSHLSGTLEVAIEVVLLEETTGAEKAHAVRSRVVGEANLEPVFGELMSIRGAVSDVTLDLGGDHLADDVLVGETHDEAVLGGSELVLVLANKTLARVVVGLTLTAALVLDLETLVVSFVLHNLDETHG